MDIYYAVITEHFRVQQEAKAQRRMFWIKLVLGILFVIGAIIAYMSDKQPVLLTI